MAAAAIKTSIKTLDVAALRRRFSSLNLERQRRMVKMLRDKQRIFFEVLPLSLHANFELLPGYLKDAPQGISDFKPTKATQEAVKKEFVDFKYRHRAQRVYDVQALYLMGSSGTIAHSEKSDFDIWIVVRSKLSEKKRELLREKARLLEEWARSLKLEVHCFVLDTERFRAGEIGSLSHESSGSSQHTLLLDEFYRTGILLAGRYPIWWLVPVECEENYSQAVEELLSQRRINANEFIDFGPIVKVPAGEFFGATVWNLFKAIETPYKAVLKIQLLEIYASEYPQIGLLCQRFKQTVHRGDITVDRVDPYVMMANRVQEYLIADNSVERLELARRCFYFKADIPLSKSARRSDGEWRRELLAEITSRWGWDEAHLVMLDSHESWKIQRVVQERRVLVDELTRSYSRLSDFAREHTDETRIDPMELTILGRRLYSAFERKAGKIELINPGISADLTESQVSIHQDRSGQGGDSWLLFKGMVDEDSSRLQAPLKRCRSVLELLTWCHFNNVIGPYTRTTLFTHGSDLSLKDVAAVIENLERLFPHGWLQDTPMESYRIAACIDRSAIFINLGVNPMAEMTRRGQHLVSDSNDALRYGGLWKNLALTFDQVIVTSWEEVLTFRYQNVAGLLECLCNYVKWAPLDGGQKPKGIAIHSFSTLRSSMIGRRIEELFIDVFSCFYREYQATGAAYILQAEHNYYVIERDNNLLHYQRLDDEAALFDYLLLSNHDRLPIVFDRYALNETPLPTIYRQNQVGVVQFYYHVRGQQVTIYVLDEQGSLISEVLPYHESGTLLSQFAQFFEAVMWRTGQRGVNQPDGLFDEQVEYHRIAKNRAGEYILEKSDISKYRGARKFFGLQVLSESGGSSAEPAFFTVFCDDQEFSGLQHGDDLFDQVARFVVARRESGERYPIYITDIDLSPALLGSDVGGEIHTAHYLRYKWDFETRLNAALRKIN